MIYTVTFNPALDYTVFLEQLEPGEVNRIRRDLLLYGGKGINVSWVLQELGMETVALGFSAGFTGRQLEQGLAAHGIRTDFVRLPEGMTRINVKIKAAQETDLNAPGPEIPASALHTLEEKLEHLKPGDVLVLAGSIPPSLPSNVYEKILSRLEGRGILYVVDATGDLLKKVLKYRPFLVKPNRQELGELFHQTLETDDQVADAAWALQKEGASNVLVSLGKDGALLADAHGVRHRMGVTPGKPVNAVGAGDSMVAGFLAGYLQTGDYSFALRLGTAAGGATATSDGLGTRETILKLLETI